VSAQLLLLVGNYLSSTPTCEAHSQFSLIEAVEGRRAPDIDPQLKPYTEWAGDACCSLNSSEGIPLVVYIPQFLTNKALVGFQILSAIKFSQLTASLFQKAVNRNIAGFVDVIPPGKGKTKISMGKVEAIYKGGEDEKQGELCVTRHWHAIGRKVHNLYAVSLTPL
jgi:hypothetical protein